MFGIGAILLGLGGLELSLGREALGLGGVTTALGLGRLALGADGRELLVRGSPVNLEGVQRLFLDKLGDDETALLAALWRRLDPEGDVEVATRAG